MSKVVHRSLMIPEDKQLRQHIDKVLIVFYEGKIIINSGVTGGYGV